MTATLDTAPTTRRTTRSRATRPRTQRDSATRSVRAAIYARVSHDQTGEGASVAQQEKVSRALIRQRRWKLAGVYVDNSITGTGKKHRPEFYAMLDAVKRGEIDAIVARHMDRIARNPRERLELVEACRDQGVIIAVVEGTDMDPTTASGRMVIGMLGEVAEMELGLKKERQSAALRERALAGKVPFGRPLYGYDTAGHIVPKEAAVVRDIFDRFYAGESLRSLAAMLTKTKVPTRNGAPWNTRTIRDMLTNPRYAGWVLYQGEIAATDDDGNPVRGNWAALIDPDVFGVIQTTLSNPARRTNREGTHRRYLGSSLYQCATCDGPVTIRDGGKYFCQRGHLIRTHRHVDEFVCDVIAERLSAPNLAELLAPSGPDTKPLRDEAKSLRARLATIDNEYDDGIIDGQRWRTAKGKVSARLREIEKQLAAHKGGAALGRVVAARDPAKAFLDADVMAQRAVIEALVTVELHRNPKGRLKRDAEGRERIDPATVVIDWKR